MAASTMGADVLTVADVERRYPDEWVAMEVIRKHKNDARTLGRVLFHSRERDAILAPLLRYRQAHPEAHLYHFFTGDLVPEDAVVVL